MAEERLQRRLAAILSADVVGYSRLMGMDEAGTLSRLNELRRELIDPAIAAHSGRIVKLMGDGALVEFASAVDAVTCAIEIQRQLRERDAGVSKVDPIRFRIGINVGDIIIKGDDILGDGVNIAARIEGIAEPGGISISEDAWRQVQGKVAANFVNAGEQSLKNIARPVRVYRLDLARRAVTASDVPRPVPAQSDKPSIAVLAFNNMSGDPEQEYFSDGISEDIITDLSKLSELHVIARNSSFTCRRSASGNEADFLLARQRQLYQPSPYSSRQARLPKPTSAAGATVAFRDRLIDTHRSLTADAMRWWLWSDVNVHEAQLAGSCQVALPSGIC